MASEKEEMQSEAKSEQVSGQGSSTEKPQKYTGEAGEGGADSPSSRMTRSGANRSHMP